MKSLVLILAICFASISYADHNHDNGTHVPVQGHGDHKDHGALIEVGNMKDAPSILGVTVIKDNMKGYNLYVETANFEFAPDMASKAHKMGEGHAHLLINGKKITRLYGNWFYLGELAQGMNHITVTLNGNNHGSYAIDGQAISKMTMVEVK